jgi:ABC-type nitrate/sulfonate/bicarbonate transport system permease component
MRYTDASARSRASVPSHSPVRTLLVALLVSLAPLAALVAVSSTGVTAAFLAGAATAVVLAVDRGRFRADRRSVGTTPATAALPASAD